MEFWDVFFLLVQIKYMVILYFWQHKIRFCSLLSLLNIFASIYPLLEYINIYALFIFFYSIRKKSELESEIQSLLKMRSRNEEFLKQLYNEAYNIGAIYHLTRFKTEELEQKVAEVRRKFKVCVSVFFLVIKRVMSLNFIDSILIDFHLNCISFFQKSHSYKSEEKSTFLQRSALIEEKWGSMQLINTCAYSFLSPTLNQLDHQKRVLLGSVSSYISNM